MVTPCVSKKAHKERKEGHIKESWSLEAAALGGTAGVQVAFTKTPVGFFKKKINK